jgi:hypothetical protein
VINKLDYPRLEAALIAARPPVPGFATRAEIAVTNIMLHLAKDRQYGLRCLYVWPEFGLEATTGTRQVELPECTTPFATAQRDDQMVNGPDALEEAFQMLELRSVKRFDPHRSFDQCHRGLQLVCVAITS